MIGNEIKESSTRDTGINWFPRISIFIFLYKSHSYIILQIFYIYIFDIFTHQRQIDKITLITFSIEIRNSKGRLFPKQKRKKPSLARSLEPKTSTNISSLYIYTKEDRSGIDSQERGESAILKAWNR